jgi:acetylornithine deacetylase/succinyl-diaminopimelate desuccinylase-like protein
VSLRLPPGADPAEAFTALEAHLVAAVPWGLRVEVAAKDRGEGFAVDTSGHAYAAARLALATAWGVTPVDIGIGGSIPFVTDLAARFPRAEVLVTGVEDPASNPHGLDESVHVGEWERVCLAEALLLESLAAVAAGGSAGQ